MPVPLPMLLMFDLDGTLYRTASSFLPTMRAVYSAYGRQDPDDKLILSRIGEPFDTFLDWLVAQGLSQDRAELAQVIAQREQQSIQENGALFPGTAETLRTLAERGCRLAICTNGDRLYAESVLGRFNLLALFASIQTLEDNTRTKADMINDLRRTFPHRHAWMIGDRYHDLEAGRNTGCTIVAATYGYGTVDEMSSADHHLARIVDLPNLVRTAVGVCR